MDHDEEDEEDIDIAAIYVLGDKKVDFTGPEADQVFERAIKDAMRQVRRKHKEAGVPMVVWRDGKVVYIQPDEIEKTDDGQHRTCARDSSVFPDDL